MHEFTDETRRVAEAVLSYALERVRMDPPPLDGVESPSELRRQVGETVTETGLGGERALALYRYALAPATISIDHPRFLAFVPSAPTEAAVLFDLVVGASCVYGGSWLEASGAVFAENQALRWIADLAGFPDGAGGVFVQGGTLGNLSALVAARETARRERGERPAGRRWRIATSASVHSSVPKAAAVMDADVLPVPVDADLRMSGAGLAAALDADGGEDVCAVVATAGTTNLGLIDRLDGVAEVCRERGIWLHVDGAYGGAALAAPSVRERFTGIEHADSFIVDPHKWLFAPFDSCALLYRRPELARAAHRQNAAYLDPLYTTDEWNPSDYAVQLTRRARGLPFWFSLATHGTAAYRDAIERTLAVTREAAEVIRGRPELELVVESDLSVLVFRRAGWSPADYDRWSDGLLRSGTAFVMPTLHDGETVGRVCIVNPRTTVDDVTAVLDPMRDATGA